MYRLIKWQGFFYSLQVAVLVDACMCAFTSGKVYQTAQIFFTLLFDLEFILKLLGMGFRGQYVYSHLLTKKLLLLNLKINSTAGYSGCFSSLKTKYQKTQLYG